MISAALLSADRGRVLVSRLLSFARRQHLETKVVDLRELVGGMSDLIARSVGADIAMEMERSEEHTSELQSLMRISYAVFCLKKKKRTKERTTMDHKLNYGLR